MNTDYRQYCGHTSLTGTSVDTDFNCMNTHLRQLYLCYVVNTLMEKILNIYRTISQRLKDRTVNDKTEIPFSYLCNMKNQG